MKKTRARKKINRDTVTDMRPEYRFDYRNSTSQPICPLDARNHRDGVHSIPMSQEFSKVPLRLIHSCVRLFLHSPGSPENKQNQLNIRLRAAAGNRIANKPLGLELRPIPSSSPGNHRDPRHQQDRTDHHQSGDLLLAAQKHRRESDDEQRCGVDDRTDHRYLAGVQGVKVK